MNNFGININGEILDNYSCWYLHSITEVDFSNKSRKTERWDSHAFINDLKIYGSVRNETEVIHFIKMSDNKNEFIIRSSDIRLVQTDLLKIYVKNNTIPAEKDFKFKIYSYATCRLYDGNLGYGVSVRDDKGALVYINGSGGEISFARDVKIGNVGGNRLYLYGITIFSEKGRGYYVSKPNGELAILHIHDISLDSQLYPGQKRDYADARSYVKPISIKMPTPYEEELVRKRGKYFYLNADSHNVNVISNPYKK